MSYSTGKLYQTKIKPNRDGDSARLELKGSPLSIVIYGSETQQSTIAAMTPATEALTEDSYYSLDTLPLFISFVGTATRIEIGGYDLTEIGDIS